jgi:hypothetical protein
MRFIARIFALVLKIHLSLCLKTDELICSLANKHDACSGEYWKKCGSSLCSIDVISCENYLFSRFSNKLFKLPLKICPINDWISTDICKKSTKILYYLF